MIREVNQNDRDIYLQLSREFYGGDCVISSISDENFSNTFEHIIEERTHANAYIMSHDEEIAGYCLTAITYSNEANGYVIWIEEFYVRPEFRSLGLGSSLISHIENQYKGKLRRLRLEVTKDNTRAKELYMKHGLKELAYIPMYKDYK